MNPLHSRKLQTIAGQAPGEGDDLRALHGSETSAQLRMAVDLAGIASWRHDLATGLIANNVHGWAILGLAPRPQGLAASEFRALLHPDDEAEVLRLSHLARHSDQPLDIAARVRHSDGHWRFLMVRCASQRDAQGAVVALVGVTMDMTERFSHSQRETELSRRLEMAASAAGVGVWSFQPDRADMHWDAQMRHLHGAGDAPPPVRLSAYLERFVHPDDRAAVDDGMRTLLARRAGLLDLDFRVMRLDGSTRRVASRTSLESQDDQVTLYGVLLDVTDRHQAEERLREADQRIALATRGAGIGTWELSMDGQLVWWDDQMFRMRGLAPRALPLRTQDALQMVHPDDRDQLMRNLLSDLEPEQLANYEFRVVLPDGKHRWIASRSSVTCDELGQSVRRIGINWDITEARATAAERQEKLLARRESQGKSQFLARMSHELRTPLNAVIGFAKLLIAEGEQAHAETARQRLGHVLSAGEHLLGLINEVLDLSSLESGELPKPGQAVALGPVIDEVLPLVESLAATHEVTLQCVRRDGSVVGDPTRLRQVLINLLSNAIKYNRPGGLVSVDTLVEADSVLIQVRDTGRGMSAQQLQQLFEPFNRLGAEREGIDGTGIGLAIVRAAVQYMQGTVQVTSRPDEGTCFEVRLPRATETVPGQVVRPGAKPPLSAGSLEAPTGRSHDVLYIEDNSVNMLIVAALVGRRPDLVFHEAGDGARGIAAAQRLRPALVLVDMQLPDMDGIEVLRQLRAHPATADLRCVALSANAMPLDIHRALDAGFDAYWTKPLDFDAFASELAAQFGPAPILPSVT